MPASCGNPLAFSLRKYSYVTSPRMYAKLLWTHLYGRGELLAVFDEVTIPSTQGSFGCRKFLKIIQEDRLIVSRTTRATESYTLEGIFHT